MKFLERGNLSLDMADNHSDGTALAENVHTETAHIAGAHGEVAFLVRLETLLLVAVHDIVQEGIHHGRIDSGFEQLSQRAVDTVNRRNAGTDMQVRSLVFHHRTQQLFNLKICH